MPRNICAGQRIDESKYLESKSLRQRMTQAERLLWERLRNGRVEGLHFRRQQIIAGFIVDFYCHKAGLIIEVDGAIHLRKKEADSEREAILKAMGFRLIRFTNKEVLVHADEVVQKILLACSPDPTPPPPAPPPPLPLREGEEGDGGRRG